jgi:hypothetical protein
MKKQNDIVTGVSALAKQLVISAGISYLALGTAGIVLTISGVTSEPMPARAYTFENAVAPFLILLGIGIIARLGLYGVKLLADEIQKVFSITIDIP